MAKIVAFEGIDYSGKTTAVNQLAAEFGEDERFCFNNGVIFPSELSDKLASIASSGNSTEREFLYTMGHVLDAVASDNSSDNGKVYFRDRYWASIIAYGRFLNQGDSIHSQQDFRPLLLPPTATILLSCSYEEMIQRSKSRKKKSRIDEIVLGNSSQYSRLEDEINLSVEGLPNVFRIDTTEKTCEEVVLEVKDHLYRSEILTR